MKTAALLRLNTAVVLTVTQERSWLWCGYHSMALTCHALKTQPATINAFTRQTPDLASAALSDSPSVSLCLCTASSVLFLTPSLHSGRSQSHFLFNVPWSSFQHTCTHTNAHTHTQLLICGCSNWWPLTLEALSVEHWFWFILCWVGNSIGCLLAKEVSLSIPLLSHFNV